MFVLSWIKFFRGYVYVHLTGYATERFLNLCGSRNILIWNLKPTEDGYYFYISVDGYRSLKPILKKTKTKARILKKYGVPFQLFRYRKHKVFAAGIAVSAVLLFYCSGFVWNIEVKGNSYLSEETILTFLQNENAGFGVPKRNIDCEELEEKLRSAYSEVIWTSVKVYGTKMTVELQENLLPEEEYEAKDDTPEDIVAKKDGVIASMVTRTGTPLVTADMEVKKGDILVSGRAEILNDDGEVAEYIYPGADADIIAEVNFYYEDEINISYQDKIKTGRAKKDYGIRFFDYHLKNPIFRQDYEQFDLTEHASQLHFTDNFYLPVYFETYLYEECKTEEKTYSKTEAAAIAQSRFAQYLANLEEKGIQILEKNVMIEKADQKYVVTGTVDAYESIVSYQPTEILEITSEERQQPNESD